MNDPTTLIPTTGYHAWFLGRDGEPFALPVVALVPRSVCYGDGEYGEPIVDTEWEPAILTAAGTLLEVDEADTIPALVGGVLVGLAPASMGQEQALALLETVKVMPDVLGERATLGTVDDPEMVGRVTAARHRLPRRLSAAR